MMLNWQVEQRTNLFFDLIRKRELLIDDIKVKIWLITDNLSAITIVNG